MQTIDEYIKSQPQFIERDGTHRPYRQADLARAMGVHPNVVTRFKSKSWKIHDGRLWSPKQRIASESINRCGITTMSQLKKFIGMIEQLDDAELRLLSDACISSIQFRNNKEG